MIGNISPGIRSLCTAVSSGSMPAARDSLSGVLDLLSGDAAFWSGVSCSLCALIISAGQPDDGRTPSLCEGFLQAAAGVTDRRSCEELCMKTADIFISESVGISELVLRCMSYIKLNVSSPLRISELASFTNFNGEYLARRFRKEAGMSIPHYVTREKIRAAKRMLLSTDRSLVEISGALAFSSQSYFQNVFKKFTGITPREFRESRKDNEKQLKIK